MRTVKNVAIKQMASGVHDVKKIHLFLVNSDKFTIISKISQDQICW